MSTYSITDKCIGCTLCARNCPAKAITGQVKEQHTINPELCIRCGLCGKLCAKEAILDENGNATHRVKKEEWKHPVIDIENCAGCRVCVENCPKDCLALTDPQFHGDIHTYAFLKNADDCIACGICSTVCPIIAIEMR